LSCSYIKKAHNVIILCATGTGKTYLACAIDVAANRSFYASKYIRPPNLLVEIALARVDGSYRELMRKYKKIKLLILDEWLLCPLKESEARDLLELVEARSQTASTVFCSQFDVPGWHESLADPTLADAICDRIVYNSHTVTIKGGIHEKARRSDRLTIWQGDCVQRRRPPYSICAVILLSLCGSRCATSTKYSGGHLHMMEFCIHLERWPA